MSDEKKLYEKETNGQGNTIGNIDLSTEKLLREWENILGNIGRNDFENVVDIKVGSLIRFFDLIHRLQSENAEQNAEIERLTERCEIAEGTKNRLTIFDRIEIKDKVVKTTIKEVLEIAKQYNHGFECDMDRFERAIKDRYSVEVE